MLRYLFIFISVLLLLSSCGNEFPNKVFEIEIKDSLNLLSEKDKALFKDSIFPKGIVPCIISVDSIDQASPGFAADQLYDNFVKKQADTSAFKDFGLMIIISQKPQLIQTRAGSEIKPHARWKGITAGHEYLQIQQKANNDSMYFALKDLAVFLKRRLPELTAISAAKRLDYNTAANYISDEIEEFGLPSESFYSKLLLKPVLKLRVLELKKMGTWWLTYMISAVVIFLLLKISEILIKWLAGLIKIEVFSMFLNLGLKGLVGIYLSIPVLSSAVILSSGRLEDVLAIQASGIPLTDYLSISSSSFGIAAPLWLVILLGGLRFLKGLAGMSGLFTMSKLPDRVQNETYLMLKSDKPHAAGVIQGLGNKGQYLEDIMDEEVFEKQPYTYAFSNQLSSEAKKAGIWMFLALGFFSKAVVLAAVFLWILPTIKGLFKYLKEIKIFNKTYPQLYINKSILFKVPLGVFAFITVIALISKYSAYLWYIVAILLSPGILSLSVTDYFVPELSSWHIWGLALFIPVFYLVRFSVAMFQTMEILRKITIRFAIVWTISISVLLFFYFKMPNFAVVEHVKSILPKTPITEFVHNENKGVISVGVLNLRERPDLKSKVLHKLNPKDTFNILETQDNWWYIRLKKVEGYVFSEYVREIINDEK